MVTNMNLQLTSINNRLAKLEQNRNPLGTVDDEFEALKELLPIDDIDAIKQFDQLLKTNKDQASLFVSIFCVII